jgi:hypothetical protein
VKAELDKVDDEYLGVVQRKIESLEGSPPQGEGAAESWREFLASTYGSLSDVPIEGGEQGEAEDRDPLR